MANIIETYEGFPITFQNKNGKMMVNATQMAKAFGKQPKDWLKNEQASRIISCVSARRNLLPSDLVIVINGGKDFGTWMHEDVALPFAQWLSPEFYIWCNDHIKERIQNVPLSTSYAVRSSPLPKSMSMYKSSSKQRMRRIFFFNVKIICEKFGNVGNNA